MWPPEEELPFSLYRSPLRAMAELVLFVLSLEKVQTPRSCCQGPRFTPRVHRQATPNIQRPPRTPILLEKPIQLPPTFLQDRKGESSAWKAQSQDPSLQSPGLEPQSLAGPCHDAGVTQEPPRVSPDNLGNVSSRDSSVTSSRHCSLEKCSNISRLSSGYEGDEENSKVSLDGSRRFVRLKRRLNNPGGRRPDQPAVRHLLSQPVPEPVGQRG
ncbi:hypothetical protein HPG69_005261 [Diceros bicornis minor]|uniref:Uncharacterized protein n=1 Tax=Diceros bicornis minor TaxID=77932 RepID=A0A7J7EGD3_DICBM|nr:hypothetical protein HPG69_005261 [Diceros bicornis minor]